MLVTFATSLLSELLDLDVQDLDAVGERLINGCVCVKDSNETSGYGYPISMIETG